MTPAVPEVVDAAVDREPPEHDTVWINNQADGENGCGGDRAVGGVNEGVEAEREARESEAFETGAEHGNQAFASDTTWRNAGGATLASSLGEEDRGEDEWEGEEQRGDVRDGNDGDLGSAGWEILPQDDRRSAAGAATQQQPAQEAISHGGGAVASILDGLTTSVSVEAELQCTLCHEVLCKPVTTSCGHSFCRVCLVEFLLSREVSETQCPICRTLVLPKSIQEGQVDAPVFSINVTLWNVIQLLVPAMREREAKEEDDDYAHKYDQFDAKWRMAALRQAADRDQDRPRRRRRHAHDEDDEIDDSEEEEDEGEEEREEEFEDPSSDEEGGLPARQVELYPELRRENFEDGHLRLVRNVVLDRDDVNADGYHSMRVGLAIMEFPSVFQLYNEHQEVAIAVLKLEEDEDLDGGFPFFTSDDGDDDALIIADYYNQIRLRVLDDAGNVVMERLRAANQGIVTFPALRLDVPGGTYHFQFTDDLYEVSLMVTTELREPGEEDDDSLGEEDHDHRRDRFVLDQAGERNRQGRGRHSHRHSEDEDDDGEYDSEDSFIAAEDEDVGGHDHDHEEAFSGSEQESEVVVWDGDEDEEERMERLEQRRLLVGREGNEAFDPPDHDYGHGHAEEEEEGEDLSQGQAFDDDEHQGHSQSDAEPDEHFSPASRPSRKRARIVDDDSEDDDQSQEVSEDESVDSGAAHDHVHQDSAASNQHTSGTKRSRAIYESEDEGDEETKESSERESVPRGFTSNKRLRQVTSRIFHDDEDEEDEEEDAAASAAIEVDGGENHDQALDSRWISDGPYDGAHVSAHDGRGEASEDDDSDHGMRHEGYGQSRAAYFDDDADHADSDGSIASEGRRWNNRRDVVEDAEEDFSD